MLMLNVTIRLLTRKGSSVGIFISKKIRFYKAVQNFLKKYLFVNLLINIVYYVYIDLYIQVMFLLLKVIECKTLRSIYLISLVFHNACFE